MNKENLIYCVDVGGTRTKFGLFDPSSRSIIASLVRSTETGGFAPFIAALADILQQLCLDANVSGRRVTAASIGIPGYVAGDEISMIWSSVSFLEGNSLIPALQSILGIPVRIENDARLVALGEAHFGEHGPAKRLLSLTIGTGLGVSLVVDGKLQEPTSITHLAGHIPIRLGARPCFCGFNGCLESLVSADALVSRFTELCQNHPEIPCNSITDVARIFQAAQEGHPLALEAVDLHRQDLITGLNAYVLVYGPDLIVLGGGLSISLKTWLPAINRSIFTRPYHGYQVEIHCSTLGDQAGLYGAAALYY